MLLYYIIYIMPKTQKGGFAGALETALVPFGILALQKYQQGMVKSNPRKRRNLKRKLSKRKTVKRKVSKRKTSKRKTSKRKRKVMKGGGHPPHIPQSLDENQEKMGQGPEEKPQMGEPEPFQLGGAKRRKYRKKAHKKVHKKSHKKHKKSHKKHKKSHKKSHKKQKKSHKKHGKK